MTHQPNSDLPNLDSYDGEGLDINYSPGQCTPDLAGLVNNFLDVPDNSPHGQTSSSQPTAPQEPNMRQASFPAQPSPAQSPKEHPNQPPVETQAAHNRAFNRAPRNTPSDIPSDTPRNMLSDTAPKQTTVPPKQMRSPLYTLDNWKGTTTAFPATAFPATAFRMPHRTIQTTQRTRLAHRQAPQSAQIRRSAFTQVPSPVSTPMPPAQAFQNTPRTMRKINAYFPEPALQSSTYQIPIRSREVALANTIMCSFPRMLMLFLLGTALACAVGLAFPDLLSWVLLGSIVSAMMRGLAVAVLFSLTVAFVLEFR